MYIWNKKLVLAFLFLFLLPILQFSQYNKLFVLSYLIEKRYQGCIRRSGDGGLGQIGPRYLSIFEGTYISSELANSRSFILFVQTVLNIFCIVFIGRKGTFCTIPTIHKTWSLYYMEIGNRHLCVEQSRLFDLIKAFVQIESSQIY